MQTPTLVADGFTNGDAYGLAAANKECSSAAAIGSRADGKCQKCGAAAGYREVHCWDDPTGLVRSRPKDFSSRNGTDPIPPLQTAGIDQLPVRGGMRCIDGM
jgi:hypothetical protein